MNKIILDRENNVGLKVSKDSICNIGECYKLNELNIELENDVVFILNHYSEIDNNSLCINIKLNNNSEFIYNHSFKNLGKYNLNINVNMCGNNSKNVINIHGISDNALTNIVVDGSVFENTNNNELDEKIKMLNINNGTSKIVPNMFINTKNVLANHSASVTDFNEDYLFYLNSKGISDEDAKELMINGFLNNDAKE